MVTGSFVSSKASSITGSLLMIYYTYESIFSVVNIYLAVFVDFLLETEELGCLRGS